MPEIVGSAELQVREVGSGPMGGGLVEAAEAVARQGRPGAGGHAVPAARSGEDQGVRVRPGRELAVDRLDHRRSQGDLANAGVTFGSGLEAAAEPAAW